ncbi:MAG: hypothetical protein MET45_20160 [Nostoc sp. LLA-1]|nr:hypothetical protein [Cyanocohniella sp. LLY]
MLLSRQAIAAPLVACFCLLGVSLIQFPQLQILLRSKQAPSLEIIERELHSESLSLNLLKKMPSFGYGNLIANWVYLSYLQYFGDDEVRGKTGYRLSPEYFEVILERDPRFLAAYLSLSSSTTIYAGMPERSIGLMEKGLKSLSPWVPKRSYYVWRYKGIDELLFASNTESAQQSFTTASEWASNFSDEESQLVAEASQRTARFLSQNPSRRSTQISAWVMVLNNQVDERTRKRAISEIEALGGKVTSSPEGNRITFPQD